MTDEDQEKIEKLYEGIRNFENGSMRVRVIRRTKVSQWLKDEKGEIKVYIHLTPDDIAIDPKYMCVLIDMLTEAQRWAGSTPYVDQVRKELQQLRQDYDRDAVADPGTCL